MNRTRGVRTRIRAERGCELTALPLSTKAWSLSYRPMRKLIATLVSGLALLALTPLAMSQAGTGAETGAGAMGGPIRLTQPLPRAVNGKQADGKQKSNSNFERKSREAGDPLSREDEAAQRPEPAPSEFELFVSRLATNSKSSFDRDGEPMQLVRYFGSQLSQGNPVDEGDDGPSLVPEDYLIGAGDEILLNLWGSVEANLRLQVDRTGMVAIPRVGSVAVSGLRFSELRKVLALRVGQQFKNFDLSVALGAVKSVRVYVTGFVQKPGAYPVSALSSMLQAVMAAGGPTAVGSFRNIQLRRGSATLSSLDLYDFLLKGDRSADRPLRSGDVIHVGAVGPQVGVIGSVNNQAVFELRAGETVNDVLRMAGGASAVANRTVASLYSFDDKAGQALKSVDLQKDQGLVLKHGDVLRISSAADLARPSVGLSKRVRVDGEVQRPGDYVLPAGSTLRDAIAAAGGLTSEAFVFGAEFTRESTRISQQENYDRALRELETEFNRAAVTRKEKVVPPDGAVVGRSLDQLQLIERLRSVKPTGRIVLQFGPQDRDLPLLAVEDRDRLFVPSRPTSINVYGSVFNGGSYLFADGRNLEQYLSLAGGPTRNADADSTFVIRANGSVVSARNTRSGWSFSGAQAVEALAALPGDTIFVPENMNKVSWTQEAKDWASILSQFGLGAVALKNLK